MAGRTLAVGKDVKDIMSTQSINQGQPKKENAMSRKTMTRIARIASITAALVVATTVIAAPKAREDAKRQRQYNKARTAARQSLPPCTMRRASGRAAAAVG